MALVPPEGQAAGQISRAPPRLSTVITARTDAEAFQDHYGWLPRTWDDWLHRLARPGCRPDLSHVVVADGEVVAYCLNGVYPQDWDVGGRKDGWIVQDWD